jgi:hypothetical protein
MAPSYLCFLARRFRSFFLWLQITQSAPAGLGFITWKMSPQSAQMKS